MCVCGVMWLVRSSVMIVMVDKSKSFGADPRLFDYVVREVQDSSRVHIVPASKLR